MKSPKKQMNITDDKIHKISQNNIKNKNNFNLLFNKFD